MREWVYFVGVGDGTLLYPDCSSHYRNLHVFKFLELVFHKEKVAS